MANKTRNSVTTIREEELPASFRKRDHSLALPCDHLENFLADDLSIDRIERIASYLWIVGRAFPPRALNLQIVLNRTIIPTTDASLHLVWTPGKIFVKALPRYFLAPTFFQQYLQGGGTHGPALGLLFTYISLVATELDFELARELHLMPSDADLTWQSWKALCRRMLESYPDNSIYASEYLPVRYKYGELRLGRLNKIYRCLGADWLHGYSNLTGMSTYAQFFTENLGFVTGFTVYIVVVLSAMSVGLSTDELKDNDYFRRACYGFAIFSIIGPVAAIVAIVVLFIIIFFANWARTEVTKRTRLGRRRSEAKGF